MDNIDPCRWSPSHVYHEEYTPLIVVFYVTFIIEVVILVVAYFYTKNDFVPKDGRDLNNLSDLDETDMSHTDFSRVSE